jgi:hypothetical protein
MRYYLGSCERPYLKRLIECGDLLQALARQLDMVAQFEIVAR